MLGGARAARRRRGWHVLLRCPDDWGLLPPGLHIAAAAAQEHDVLRDDGGGRGGGPAALQTLPTDCRRLCFAACRRGRAGVPVIAPLRRHPEARPTRPGRGGPPPLFPPGGPAVYAWH